MTLCLLLSALAVNECPLYCLVSATGFAHLRFLLVMPPFYMVPKPSAEVLPAVPKHKKAATRLTENTCVR